MSSHGVLRVLSAAALLASAPGCFFSSDDDSRPPVVVGEASGFLTIEWYVDGTTDPAACDYWYASDFEMMIYDGAGYFYTEVEAPCDDFAVTVEMPEDTYSADVTLVDYDDIAVSVSLPLDALRVEMDSELVIAVDFQADSML